MRICVESFYKQRLLYRNVVSMSLSGENSVYFVYLFEGTKEISD